jgi:hypothetical protein
MKKVIVVTGASSGFGALAARARSSPSTSSSCSAWTGPQAGWPGFPLTKILHSEHW